jgi:hypothetical protein
MNSSRKFPKMLWGALVFCLFETFFASCASTYRQKMYADVIGFNDDVITNTRGSLERPYNLDDSGEAKELGAAIWALSSGSNTAAFYALDVALDRIVEVQKNKELMEGDPSTKYYIVFFTDGLDNVSLELARRNRRGDYPNTAEYGAALQERMSQILKKYSLFGLIKSPNMTNSFQSYVLLYKGEDIERSGYTEEELDARLQPFTGAQNEQRPVVIQGSDLEKLLEDFKNAFVVSSFSFIIPKGYTGERIRMRLNPEDDPNPVYFEADFKRQKRTRFFFFQEDYYTLENIQTSDGFTLQMPADGIIPMDAEFYNAEENTVPFIINGLKNSDRLYRVDKLLVTQWHYDGGWRINSEYKPDSGSKKNAYVLLVMDTSTSFATQIDAAKETAEAIILYISSQM